MPRKASGQVVRTVEGFAVRVPIAGAGRRRFALAVATEEAAEDRARTVAGIATRLRGVAGADEIAKLCTAAGGARSMKALATILEAVETIARGDAPEENARAVPTFATWAEEWTSGRLHKRFPDHVKKKDGGRDASSLRLYINPIVGHLRVCDVRLEHAERVMSALPSTLSSASRRHVAQTLRKVLSLAVYPGRFRETNPIPREWMPKIRDRKAKAFLYPSEDAALMRCTAIPLERRLAYGILAREGLRSGELEALRWGDLDLERGLVRLDENKTDDPRTWALRPDVARALAWWKRRALRALREASGEDVRDEELARERVLERPLRDGAWWLRGDAQYDPTLPESTTNNPGDLRRAGVTREELFARTATRQPLRLHDLRATFVTLSLAAGRSEAWVTDRTGHKSSQMVSAYARQARTWAEAELGALGALDELLPELASPAAKRGAKGPAATPAGLPRGARRGPNDRGKGPRERAVIGPRVVGREGLEPSTYGLKVRSSTD
jgi:integrase